MNDIEFRRRAHALLMRLGHVGGCVECGKSPFAFRGFAIPEPMEEVDALRKAGAERPFSSTSNFLYQPPRRCPTLPEFHCGSAGCPGTAENPCAGSPAWKPRPATAADTSMKPGCLSPPWYSAHCKCCGSNQTKHEGPCCRIGF